MLARWLIVQLMKLYNGMLSRKDLSRSAIADTDAVLMRDHALRRPNLWRLLELQYAASAAVCRYTSLHSTQTYTLLPRFCPTFQQMRSHFQCLEVLKLATSTRWKAPIYVEEFVK